MSSWGLLQRAGPQTSSWGVLQSSSRGGLLLRPPLEEVPELLQRAGPPDLLLGVLQSSSRGGLLQTSSWGSSRAPPEEASSRPPPGGPGPHVTAAAGLIPTWLPDSVSCGPGPTPMCSRTRVTFCGLPPVSVPGGPEATRCSPAAAPRAPWTCSTGCDATAGSAQPRPPSRLVCGYLLHVAPRGAPVPPGSDMCGSGRAARAARPTGRVPRGWR